MDFNISTVLSTFFTTLTRHYTIGPPARTWPFRLHLVVNLIRRSLPMLTIEEFQAKELITGELPKGIVGTRVDIPNRYRAMANEKLIGLLKGVDCRWDWEQDYKVASLADIAAEWHNPTDVLDNSDSRVVLYFHGGGFVIGSVESQRGITGKIAQFASTRVLSVNYRLAPQHPFPASLEDAIAAYFYLTQPPQDAGFSPILPENIIVAGDSAGGNLAMTTAIALRDLKLPNFRGIALISPWIDLLESQPSRRGNLITDYIHEPLAGGRFLPSPARDFALTLGYKAEEGRILQLYAPNSLLKFGLVSPLHEKNLAGLPPTLIQSGTAEALHGEHILFAHRLANAQTPTILDLYVDMPHVWHLIHTGARSRVPFERINDFVKGQFDGKKGFNMIVVGKGGRENFVVDEGRSEQVGDFK